MSSYSDPFGLCPECRRKVEGQVISTDPGVFDGVAALAGIALGGIRAAIGAAGLIQGALGEGTTAVEEGIYEFTATSGRTYVGQSGRITERLAEHVQTGKGAADDVAQAVRTEVKGGKTAREIAEQRRIDELGGVKSGNLENKRNPIGPARSHLMDE